MTTRYNIYYAGQVLEGHAEPEVRERLRKVFKANDSTLDKLFSGTAQLLKRDCDKDTALKYKQAMERAGAQPIIKNATAEAAAPAEAAPASTSTAQPDASDGQLSAADRIAALAAAEDVGYRRSAGPAQAETAKDYDGEVEPVGADILRMNERAPEAEPVLPGPDLALGEAGARLGQPTPEPPPAPPVDHLDMAEAGELIPNLPPQDEPLSPDTSEIDLAPEGSDFADCASPPAEEPNLDLSGIDMAPAGSDVLEEKYRKTEEAQAPSTDHISLSE